MKNSDKKAYLLRSNDMNPDPRVEKYVNFFHQSRIPYKLFGWNRDGGRMEKGHACYYQLRADYGAGMENLWNLIRWNFFLLRKLWVERKSIGFIHACDFDTVLPALLIKMFCGKKVVFDVFDWYTDSRDIPNKGVRWLIGSLERFAVRKSDHIIICEPERIVQLGNVDFAKVKVMQNIPDFPAFECYLGKKEESSGVKVGYVGILSCDRGLEVLLESVAQRPALSLRIAGFGELEQLVVDYAKRYSNIKYEGKVSYGKGLSILSDADCIYAMYYTRIKNHVLAAPNKFYESLFLGRPLITTVGTLVGDKVTRYDSGFVIKEGEEPLLRLLDNLTLHECIEKGRRAETCWRDIFCNRIADFFQKEYAPMVGTFLLERM